MGEPLDREAVLTAAARAEGHPDNVAAALLGGLTVSCVEGARVTAVSLRAPSEIEWVVLLPEREGSTREARAILPDTLARADAVFNVQRVSLLLAALAAGRAELLDLAMQDRLHQPYRQRLFPWMESVATAGRRAGALGCVLSGAGPSMLAAVRQRDGQAVAEAMERALRDAGIAGRAIALPVDPVGATWERVSET
jgi:homoserine kinase